MNPRYARVHFSKPSDVDLNPVIFDQKTGLTWDRREQRSTNVVEDLAHIARLNLYMFCGFDDWRLPTCDELLTLVDRNKANPAIDTDAFPDCRSGLYLTSTFVVARPGCRWRVNFDNGTVTFWAYPANSSVREEMIRAVRGKPMYPMYPMYINSAPMNWGSSNA